ncbi:MAG: carotenoid oxygenase family protein [Bryobacterales bacterium]
MTRSSPALAIDHAPTLDALFAEPAQEAAYAIAEIEGALPKWRRGAYYVNGPASFGLGEVRYQHWLDGDGMVAALRFEDGTTHFASRFVGTRKRTDETREGRALYRAFGTRFEGDRLRRNLMLEPPVNVAVQPFAGTLLALGEQSLPLELDPVTLETRGEFDFGGALNEVSPFAAHAKIDPTSGHLFNFGVAYAADRTTLTLYEFDKHGRRVSRRRQPLDAPYTIHDFALAPRFAVFHAGPYLMHVERLLAGGTLLDALEFDARRPSELLLVPRTKGAEPKRIRVDEGYCLHMINAFEEAETLVVDLILYERPLYAEYHPLPNLFADVSKGRVVRYAVNLETGEATNATLAGYDAAPDFPSIDPELVGKAYDQFWCLGISAAGAPGRKFFDQLVRMSSSGDDVDCFTLPQGEHFGGEPAYVAGPTPEEAVVIVEVFRPEAVGGRCGFALFRAHDLAAGPVVEIPLSTKILPGFHSSFAKEVRQ